MILLCLACLLPLLLTAGTASAHDPQPLRSPYAGQPPTVDGDLGDWEGAEFVRVTPANGVFDRESGVSDDPHDLHFEFALRNDGEYLYVAVRMVDDTIVIDSNPDVRDLHARAWMDDAIEIFIDGDHSHSPDARDTAGVEFATGGEFAVVGNGAVTSDQSGFPGTGNDPAFWTAAASYPPPPAPAYAAPFDTTTGELGFEARLNFRMMGPGVGPGSRIGFTVSVHDDDDGGGRDLALYWKGRSPSAWKDESGWGDLILSPLPTVVPATTLGKVKGRGPR